MLKIGDYQHGSVEEKYVLLIFIKKKIVKSCIVIKRNNKVSYLKAKLLCSIHGIWILYLHFINIVFLNAFKEQTRITYR